MDRPSRGHVGLSRGNITRVILSPRLFHKKKGGSRLGTLGVPEQELGGILLGLGIELSCTNAMHLPIHTGQQMTFNQTPLHCTNNVVHLKYLVQSNKVMARKYYYSSLQTHGSD